MLPSVPFLTGRVEDWQAGEQRDRQMCRQTDVHWSGFRMHQSIQSCSAVRLKSGKVNGAYYTLHTSFLEIKNVCMCEWVCVYIQYGCGYVSAIACMQTATQQTDSGNQATDSLLNLLKPQIVLSLFLERAQPQTQTHTCGCTQTHKIPMWQVWYTWNINTPFLSCTNFETYSLPDSLASRNRRQREHITRFV